MVSSSKLVSIFSKENSIKLLLISEFELPLTRQILFGYKLLSEAILINSTSSFFGRINAKDPFFDNNCEAAKTKSVNGKVSVNRAVFLALLSDL